MDGLGKFRPTYCGRYCHRHLRECHYLYFFFVFLFFCIFLYCRDSIVGDTVIDI